MKNSALLVEINYLLRVQPAVKKQLDLNLKALSQLRDLFKGRLVVNVVAQKGVSVSQFANYREAVQLMSFLEDQNFNFFLCGIPESGFHKNDGHPNAAGYEYLKACTDRAVTALEHQK